MKSSHPITIAVALVFAATVRADDPQELKSARNGYQQAVQRATEPLKARYISDLTRLRESFTRAGKLTDAVAVDNEIKTLTGQPVEHSTEVPSTPSKVSGTISAQSDTGMALGPAKKGQRIHVQYVDGTWSSTGGAPVSPDNAPHANVKVAVIG